MIVSMQVLFMFQSASQNASLPTWEIRKQKETDFLYKTTYMASKMQSWGLDTIPESQAQGLSTHKASYHMT